MAFRSGAPIGAMFKAWRAQHWAPRGDVGNATDRFELQFEVEREWVDAALAKVPSRP